jgi:hypothetical protein
MLACDIARGRLITEFTEPKLTAMANSCVSKPSLRKRESASTLK